MPAKEPTPRSTAAAAGKRPRSRGSPNADHPRSTTATTTTTASARSSHTRTTAATLRKSPRDGAKQQRKRAARASASVSPVVSSSSTSPSLRSVRDESDEEDDEEGRETLQRFSNISTAHPQHQRRGTHRGGSPPHVSATPPPSPPHDDGSGLPPAAAQQGPFLTRVPSPPLAVNPAQQHSARVGEVRETFAHGSSPTQSLLSELLLAEAERAGAAAAAAAAAQRGSDMLDLPSAYRTPLRQASSHVHPRQHPEQAFAQSSTAVHPSPFASADALMGGLMVHVGVVPLPGSSEASGSVRADALPWVRALRAIQKAQHTSTTTSHRAGGSVDRDSVAPSAVAETRAEEAIEMLSFRVLQPRRLPARSHSTIARSRATLNSNNSSSGAGRQRSPSLGTSPARTVEDDFSASTVVGSDMVGWSGVFANLPVLLPGAQLPSSPSAAGRGGEKQTNGDADSADAQLCTGAASITVMLA